MFILQQLSLMFGNFLKKKLTTSQIKIAHSKIQLTNSQCEIGKDVVNS